MSISFGCLGIKSEHDLLKEQIKSDFDSLVKGGFTVELSHASFPDDDFLEDILSVGTCGWYRNKKSKLLDDKVLQNLLAELATILEDVYDYHEYVFMKFAFYHGFLFADVKGNLGFGEGVLDYNKINRLFFLDYDQLNWENKYFLTIFPRAIRDRHFKERVIDLLNSYKEICSYLDYEETSKGIGLWLN